MYQQIERSESQLLISRITGNFGTGTGLRPAASLKSWTQALGSMPSRSFTASRNLCLHPKYFSVV
jgi:hypothetical protein